MSDANPYPTTDEIRQWAMSKKAGAGLSYSGPLPKAVIAGWNRTHPDRPYVRSEAYHGSTHGYINMNCRCAPCTASASAASQIYKQGRRDEAATA